MKTNEIASVAIVQGADNFYMVGDYEYMIKAVHLDPYYVKLEAKVIAGKEYNDPGSVPLYERFTENGAQDFVPLFENGEKFVSGSIKWDGCSNWDFHTEECMMHFCGSSDATSIGSLMSAFYVIAESLIPNWHK